MGMRSGLYLTRQHYRYYHSTAGLRTKPSVPVYGNCIVMVIHKI